MNCPCGKCHCFVCGNQMEIDREIERLREENNKLKACVEFYANEENWISDKFINGDWNKDYFLNKCGELARKTLQEIKGGQ